ncbi:unnamed protein product [Symbiodinium sp. CCMP2592]|nr:unnamed protein product [Symbiodinium sp. CCMP2592]
MVVMPKPKLPASLRRAATLVREMLQLGWEMTPARNARLLLALGKASAEGGREASLARFTAALLQMSEGFPMLLFVVDCSGARKCGTEAGVERAVAAMAECLQRHATGVTCGVITYSPAEVVQELGPDLPSLTAALAAARRQDEVEVAKALRSAKEQLKLGKKSLTENGDKQPIVIHIAASHAGNAKDSAKAMKVLEALGVTVLGLGMGDIKVREKPQHSRLLQQLRRLLAERQEIIVMPCCYDGLTARLIERMGFQLTFMTGFGVSAVHGFADCQLVSYQEMLEAAFCICGSLERICCIADGDTGLATLEGSD